MSSVEGHDQEMLRARLEDAREGLEGLTRELRALDRELEDLAVERQQHELLQQVCGALEKLDELGGSTLFWEEGPFVNAGPVHIAQVRRRVDDFNGRLQQIEARRQDLLASVRQAEESTEFIEEDLLEAEREEEARRNQWVLEREISELPPRELRMPWSRQGEDDRRFRKSLALSLALSLLLGAVLPLIDLPVPDRWEVMEVPDRFTRLLEQTPPVPPTPVEPERLAQEETKPETSEQASQAEEPQASPVPEPSAQPAATGILAFREQFSSLRSSGPTSRLGSQARIDRSGELARGNSTRSMVATQAPGSSGGIDMAAISRDAVGGGGQAIEGVEIQRATSAIGDLEGADRPLSEGPGPGRTDEEIQIVFDRHKAALYRLYNRELRKNPTLRGQMVLRLTIEPDGSVSLSELKSSDMDAAGLAARVVSRVKTFDFGAKEGVAALTILYPIDFLPAT